MKPVYVALPVKTISEANARGHWAARHTRTSHQRWVVGAALARPVVDAGLVRVGKLRRELACELVVTLVRVAPSAGLDDDNLRGALKAPRDAVADALGLASDRDPRVAWRYGQARGKAYGIEISVAPRAAAKESA